MDKDTPRGEASRNETVSVLRSRWHSSLSRALLKEPQGSGRLTQSSDPLIAFQRTANRVSQIYVMNVDGTDQRPLARGCCAAWSPDGRMIAFAQANEGSGDLLVINRDGTGLRRIASIALGTPTWSPDGRQIAFSGEGARGAAIYVVNADGSGLARLTASCMERGSARAWSPDGTQIVFERYNTKGVRGSPVIAMNADGTSQRVLTTKTRGSSSPAWSPDGRRIVFAAGTRSPGEPSDIFSMNRDGSDQRNLTRHEVAGRHRAAVLCGRAHRIVFQSFTDGPGKRDVHLIGAAGTKHLNLTRNRATDGLPAWTA